MTSSPFEPPRPDEGRTPASHRHVPLTGLYIILDPAVYGARDLAYILRQAAAAGARLFQYRDKDASMRDAYHRAIRLRQVSADAGALLIINDRCDLALAVEADGVHVGQADLPCPDARALMGSARLLGVSTHRLSEVEAATRCGADYIGFGPIIQTGTKPDHEPPVGLEGLRQARERTHLPIFAIGGLTADTAASAMRAGADGIAVVSAVATAPTVAATVRAFLASMR